MPRKFVCTYFALLMMGAQFSFGAPPLEAYGRLPTLGHIEISPDGQSIAYSKTTPAKQIVVIQSLAPGQPPTVMDFTGRKLRAVQWADSGHVIITTSSTTVARGLEGVRREYFTAQSFDLKTHIATPLLEHVKGMTASYGAMNILAGNPIPRIIDGRPVVFLRGVYFPDGSKKVGPTTWDMQDNRGQLGLFRFDLDSGETKLVSQEGRKDVEDWVLDASGKIVAEVDSTAFTQHWKLVLYKDGKPDKIVMDVAAPIESPQVVGLSEDETSIIVEMPPSLDGRIYQQVSLRDGAASPWRPDLAHAGALRSDDQTGHVLGAEKADAQTDYQFFDPDMAALWKSIRSAFSSATEVDLSSYSVDKSKAIVSVFGPSFGSGYFLLDRTAKKAYPIAAAYDGINEIYEEKWISYKAADNREIPAYLTLPKREPKSLPLIVLPHGGPHSRDYPGFDFLSQSLASRGYAVLQPQFRGSNGFGREWLEAGFHEYGKKMQTDLSDGVRALAAQGLIDPKRVCIFGASYGGYAALAGATLDAGIYRCAASLAGPADMREMLKGWPKPTMGAESARFWDRFVGIEDGNMAPADAISPAKHADRVTIPILLIHGKDDTVVPYRQSEIMASALKSAGKPYEFVTLEGEDHWLSTGKTRLEMLQAVVKFLEANNPPN